MSGSWGWLRATHCPGVVADGLRTPSKTTRERRAFHRHLETPCRSELPTSDVQGGDAPAVAKLGETGPALRAICSPQVPKRTDPAATSQLQSWRTRAPSPLLSPTMPAGWGELDVHTHPTCSPVSPCAGCTWEPRDCLAVPVPVPCLISAAACCGTARSPRVAPCPSVLLARRRSGSCEHPGTRSF